jgi:hypothetical protein
MDLLNNETETESDMARYNFEAYTTRVGHIRITNGPLVVNFELGRDTGELEVVNSNIKLESDQFKRALAMAKRCAKQITVDWAEFDGNDIDVMPNA